MVYKLPLVLFLCIGLITVFEINSIVSGNENFNVKEQMQFHGYLPAPEIAVADIEEKV